MRHCSSCTCGTSSTPLSQSWDIIEASDDSDDSDDFDWGSEDEYTPVPSPSPAPFKASVADGIFKRDVDAYTGVKNSAFTEGLGTNTQPSSGLVVRTNLVNWSAGIINGKRTRLVRKALNACLPRRKRGRKSVKKPEFGMGDGLLLCEGLSKRIRKIKAGYQRIISVVRAQQECLVRALHEWKDWEVEEEWSRRSG